MNTTLASIRQNEILRGERRLPGLRHRLPGGTIGDKKKSRKGVGDHKGNSDDEGFAQQNPHQPMLAKVFAQAHFR